MVKPQQYSILNPFLDRNPENVNKDVMCLFPTLDTSGDITNTLAVTDALYRPLKRVTGVCLNYMGDGTDSFIDNFLKMRRDGVRTVKISPGYGIICNVFVSIDEEMTLNLDEPTHFIGENVSVGSNDIVYVVGYYDCLDESGNYYFKTYNYTNYEETLPEESVDVVFGFMDPTVYNSLTSIEKQQYLLIGVIELNNLGQISENDSIFDGDEDAEVYREYFPKGPYLHPLDGGIVLGENVWVTEWSQ